MSEKNNPKIQKYLDLAQTALKKKGGRITKARLLVLQALAEASTPLNQKDILQQIKKNDRTQNVDQVSVYRILEVLTELGLVHKVGQGFLPCTHSSCQTSHHIFLICSSCGLTQEVHLPESEFDFLYTTIQAKTLFLSSSAVVNMTGVCGDCQSLN